MIIDLRSDTLTQPTVEMRKAMAEAPVGDDVFAEDPSVNQLQVMAAEMFGMEAALFVPSGTMGNQIAIGVHTRPGDEVICSSVAHIYLYEGGGMARNSGVSVRLVDGDRGRISAADVLANINNAGDAHLPLTTLVCVEDTCNKGGGSIYDFNELKKISEVCRARNLKLHCDGARLFNALVESGVSAADYGQLFDSISICLSKGLGAPIGSLLLGTKDFIKQSHRRRKSFGGGMRQAGIVAAAGIYAFENNIKRLKEDHARARALGEMLKQAEFVSEVLPVDTNIVIFKLREGIASTTVAEKLREKQILCFPFGPDRVRFVTHLHITDEMVQEVGKRLL